MSFLEFRLIDIIDIVLVAFLMYKLYTMVKGTIALNILIGLFAFVIFWLMIKALKMDLSGSILDNFVNVGVLALIIVFQQEIRRFFLHLGTKYKLYYTENKVSDHQRFINQLIKSIESFAKSKTGALIVITKEASLNDMIETGDKIDANISSMLIESIFFKNNPLHDGAIIIQGDRIVAAACILPVSQNYSLPAHMGLRHRAAMGITESTDACSIAVSEERGEITFFINNDYFENITTSELEKYLQHF